VLALNQIVALALHLVIISQDFEVTPRRSQLIVKHRRQDKSIKTAKGGSFEEFPKKGAYQ
jgi:fumarate reductase subunit C